MSPFVEEWSTWEVCVGTVISQVGMGLMANFRHPSLSPMEYDKTTLYPLYSTLPEDVLWNASAAIADGRFDRFPGNKVLTYGMPRRLSC